MQDKVWKARSDTRGAGEKGRSLKLSLPSTLHKNEHQWPLSETREVD